MSSTPAVKFEGAYGLATADGFVITFPNVTPTDKKLHECDNHDALRRLVYERTDKWPSRSDPSPMVYRSRSKVYDDSEYGGKVQSLFYNMILTAYNPHHSVCLRPEVLWQLIVHEVGTYVQQNADACAHFFTDKPNEQQKLAVLMFPGDVWEQVILRFRSIFNERIDAKVLNAFLPKFSTTDQEAEVATLLTFMDTVSKWYSYGAMYCCGFPKILVAGTVKDWKLLLSSATVLSTMFDGLRYYFADLIGVVRTIVTTLESGDVDPEFWGSMFRYHSNSCPPILDGWLSAFIAFRRGSTNGEERGCPVKATLREPHEFHWRDLWRREKTLWFDEVPKGLNYADLTVTTPGQQEQKFLLIGGVLGSDFDEYLTPRLGIAVARA